MKIMKYNEYVRIESKIAQKESIKEVVRDMERRKWPKDEKLAIFQ